MGTGFPDFLQAQLKEEYAEWERVFLCPTARAGYFYFNPPEMMFWGWFPNGAGQGWQSGDVLRSGDFSSTHGCSDVLGHKQHGRRC